MKRQKAKSPSEPLFDLSDPVEFIKCVEYYSPQLNNARNLLCMGKYNEAITVFEKIRPLIPGEDNQKIINKGILHCRKMTLGILDLRNLRCGIWHEGMPITEDQMNKVLEFGRAAVMQFGVKKTKRRGVSIGGLVMNLLEEHGLEVQYSLVESKVKEIAPDSKFNPHHLAYYRSKFKSSGLKAKPKKTQTKPQAKGRVKPRTMQS